MQFQHVRHSSRLKDRGEAWEKSASGNKAQAWVWIGRAKGRRKNILTWRASVGTRLRWRARSSWGLWSVVWWTQAWHISGEEAGAYKGFEPVLGGKQACRTSRDRAEEARVEEGWMAGNRADGSKGNGSESAGRSGDLRDTEVPSGGARGAVMEMTAFGACHVGQGHKEISNNSKLWDSRNHWGFNF